MTTRDSFGQLVLGLVVRVVIPCLVLRGVACTLPNDSVASSAANGATTRSLAPDAGSDGDTTGAAHATEDAGSAPDASSLSTTSEASATDDGGAGSGCEGATVCEGFEEDPLGALPDAGPTWSISAPDCSGTGALAIDDSQAHSGSHSLEVTGTAGYCNHVFLATSAPASIAGTVWGRFWVRLTTALDADHATFVAMHDATSASNLRMGGQDAVLMWNRESDDATLPELSPAGTALSVVPSVATWHCVEVAIDGAAGTLQTWFDGAKVAGLEVGPSASSDADGEWARDGGWRPKLTDARFGWESYAGESETLWFDDIALGPTRIGCGD